MKVTFEKAIDDFQKIRDLLRQEKGEVSLELEEALDNFEMLLLDLQEAYGSLSNSYSYMRR